MSECNPTGERDIDLALRKAINAANPDRAREALRRGADPNASIRGGREDYAPLLAAADAFKEGQTQQRLAVVEALLEAGARVDMAGATGQTPLHRAARSGWDGAVKALLDAGADPRSKNNDGDEPLHCASFERPGREVSVKTIQILLAAGSDPNAANALGLTALHYACACRHAKAIKTLARAGGDVLARSLDGRGGGDFIDANIAGEGDSLPASLRNLFPAATKDVKVSKTRQDLAWKIDQCLSDKARSSHDYLHSSYGADMPVALPGGQEHLAIDPLSILEAGGESAFAAKLIERFNAGRLVAVAGVQRAVSIEPGMSAWALPWTSYRMEGGHWTETEIKEQHFAYVVPMRGIDDQGNPISFLLMGQSHDDVKRAQEPTKFPGRAASRPMRWIMALDAKAAHAGWRSAHMGALLLEADRTWDFAWLLNPARLEQEEIERSTPSGASRGPRASL